MIIGIGTDLLDARRLERPLKMHRERFLSKILTTKERDYFEKKVEPFRKHLTTDELEKRMVLTLAKTFAGKEAFVKALGTGFHGSLGLLDLEIVRDSFGKPFFHLHEKALHAVQGIIPLGMDHHINLSLTDEYPYAQAFVILSAC